MNTFYNFIENFDISKLLRLIQTTDNSLVENILNKENIDINEFAILLSPAASNFLRELTSISCDRTQKKFGKTIQLYIPLYLSNYCENKCVYCGFSADNKIERKILNDEEILNEIKVIKEYGFEHILLVTGESPSKGSFEYIKHAIKLVKPFFSSISIEVQPLNVDEYKELIDCGVNTVYIYQETYDKKLYSKYHPSGRKSDYRYRLETPDRLGLAGIRKIGLGSLLGLNDWRMEAIYIALHLRYLEKKYWKTRYSISFPRIRPHKGNFIPPYPITEKELVQLICAYRILDNEVELSLSVRERPVFRDNAILFGITNMSAGSKTEPGAYSKSSSNLKQFDEFDTRSPQEIAEMIKSKGYEPIWKDWDDTLNATSFK